MKFQKNQCVSRILMEKDDRKKFLPCFLATGVGSLPHADVPRACALIARTMPQTPFWPQLPKHSFLESMTVQVSPGLPFLKVEEGKGEVFFDTALDGARELEKVYNYYLTGDANSYPIPAAYAGGLEGMVRYLKENQHLPLRFFKGQIVGPITFGLSLQDNYGKDIIHNEVAFDAIMKGLLLRGRWIIQRMKTIGEEVILFIDEPGLSGYGSAFFSVDTATITGRLNEMIEEFQAQGVWVGVHCCGNTDWSLLLRTKADIINFDAWGFLERFSLYPEALNNFLSRHGVLAWGIVPTSEFTGKETVEVLREKLEIGFRELSDKGISAEILRERCLLTTSCGMGLMSVEDAEKAMGLLSELSRGLREKYF
ncbi:MAG: methionine synthase [Proteobacteria bacterium]|nr:methionine synthase [Pseudomonadota bacterium]